jgi:hypothetical protein
MRFLLLIFRKTKLRILIFRKIFLLEQRWRTSHTPFWLNICILSRGLGILLVKFFNFTTIVARGARLLKEDV